MKKVLYINAGAGSGKTYRLTHDLADWLAGTNDNGHNADGNKIDPSEIIVTTFTKAAATEIKERARQVLMSKGMHDAASRLETATIGTIHSVCQMFINKYWYATGMVPDAEVMSDTDKKLYRNQSIAQMLNSGKHTSEHAKIQAYYDTFRPKKQVNHIPVDNPEFWMELLDKIVSQMSYYEVTKLTSSINDSKAEADYVFNSDAKPDEPTYLKMRENIIRITGEIFKEKNTNEGKKDHEKANDLPKKMDYSSLLTLHSFVKSVLDILIKVIQKRNGKAAKIKELKVKAAKKPLTEKQSEDLVTLQKEVAEINRAYPNLDADATALNGYVTTLEDWLRSKDFGATVKDCMDALFTLAGTWQSEYDAYKKKMSVIDYDDMEKGLRELLKNEDICNEIAGQYKLVMVDEFQDCNPIQLEIFDRLSDIVAPKSPLSQSSVWVGDPNQAIYGFRGSNTKLINDVAAKFPTDAKGNPVYNKPDLDGLMRDKLDTSYRSREALVRLANTTFGALFPQMVALNVHCKEYPEYTDAVRHWHFDDGGKSFDNYRLNLAKKIKDIVNGRSFYIVPKGTEKPRLLEYKDIAVLVSKNSDAERLAHEMKCAGVPVSVPESHILDRIEVQLMLALSHLAEKDNDHEWASVMHLWNNIPTEDILEKSIQDNARGKSSGVPKWFTYEPAYTSIKEALDVVKDMSFEDRLRNLILLLSVGEHLQKWGEADTRRQNLITLQAQARAYAARCKRLDLKATTEGFVEYLEDIDIKALKDLSSDTVKVVTYHGSKGLEWPMVILSSLEDKRIDNENIKRAFLTVTVQKDNADNYEVITFPNFLGQSYPDIFKTVFGGMGRYKNVKDSEKGDAKRLMYVGMTRAREYLVSTFFGKEKIWDKETGLSEIGIKPITNHVWHENDGVVLEEIEALDKNVSHEIPSGTYTPSGIQPFGGDNFKDMFVAPSEISTSASQTMALKSFVIQGVHFFPSGNGNHGSDYAPMGTCIHNVFAAYDPTLTQQQSDAMADRVIRQHGFNGCLYPKSVINSIKELYAWLTQNFGKGTALHEVPFRQLRADGTIVRGEMDLLWETENGTVLVDFKNFVSKDMNAPLDVSNQDHYVGKYLPQIDAYTSALKANKVNVSARLIYYSTLGLIVQLL